MQLTYDEHEDILFISFNNDPIVRDVSLGWHVNVGLTANGIGEMTILDAKAKGLLPIYVNPNELVEIAKAA